MGATFWQPSILISLANPYQLELADLGLMPAGLTMMVSARLRSLNLKA